MGGGFPKGEKELLTRKEIADRFTLSRDLYR
jgi:hypothetical protein